MRGCLASVGWGVCVNWWGWGDRCGDGHWGGREVVDVDGIGGEGCGDVWSVGKGVGYGICGVTGRVGGGRDR